MTLWVLVAGVSFAAGAMVGEEAPGAAVAGSEAVPVPMALKAVTIDGVLDEACWTAAETVRVEFVYGQPGMKGATRPAVVRYAWDREYLYVGYETFDADLRAAGTGEEDGPRGRRREGCDIGGANDVFEIFVSFNDPHFFWEIHHNASNDFSDIWVTVAAKDWPLYRSCRAYEGILWTKTAYLDEGERDAATLETAVRLKPKQDGKPGTVNQGDDVDAGYVGEMRLPWKSLGAPREWLRGADQIRGQTLVLFAAVQDGGQEPRYHHSAPNLRKCAFFHLEAGNWPRYRLVGQEE